MPQLASPLCKRYVFRPGQRTGSSPGKARVSGETACHTPFQRLFHFVGLQPKVFQHFPRGTDSLSISVPYLGFEDGTPAANLGHPASAAVSTLRAALRGTALLPRARQRHFFPGYGAFTLCGSIFQCFPGDKEAPALRALA